MKHDQRQRRRWHVTRPNCATQIMRVAAGVTLLVAGIWFHLVVAPTRAQSLELLSERQSDLSRRVTNLEVSRAGERLESRVSVLESDLFELKWLSRAMASALAVQFIATGLKARQRRKEDES